VDEREVLRAWRNLFVGKPITVDSLNEAETLLDGLSGESPLHIRLATELGELRKRSEGAPKIAATRKAPKRKVK
jgi:hypothetical protein